MQSNRLPERIDTDRLILRAPLLTDASAIFSAYATDPEVTRFLSWRPHVNVETTMSFIGQLIEQRDSGEGEQVFVIAEKSLGQTPIGTIGARFHGHEAGFGYALARSSWGRGYMSESLTALIRHVLSWPSVWRVRGVCDVENKASARVMEKAGMRLEGRLRRFFVHPNVSDEPRDCFLYAAVRDDFV